jgi:hypothetical protein
MFTDGSLTLGYEGQPWGFSHSPDDKFVLSALPIRRPLQPVASEMRRAAREIAEQFHGEEIHILYSGGVDSEGVMEAFRLEGIPARAVLMRFDTPLNGTKPVNCAEVKDAQKYLVRVDWPDDKIDVVDYGLFDWLRSQAAVEMRDKIQARNRAMTFPYPILLERYRDKPIIMGFGEPLMNRKPDGRWVLKEEEQWYSFHKAFTVLGLRGVPSFYQWSTELYHAYLGHPSWTALHGNMLAGTITSSSHLKNEFMRREMGLDFRYKKNYIVAYTQAVLENTTFWNRSFEVDVRQWLKDHGAVPTLESMGVEVIEQ